MGGQPVNEVFGTTQVYWTSCSSTQIYIDWLIDWFS